MRPVHAIAVLLNLLLAACDGAAPSAPEVEETQAAMAAEPASALSAEELAVEAPAGEKSAVPADQAGPIRIELYSESGYLDENGRHVLDLFELDYAYLTVQILSAAGHPVQGADVSFAVAGTSRVEEMTPNHETNGAGMFDFGVVGGTMGLDRVTIRSGDASAELVVNVISLEAAGYPALAVIEGSLPWDQLLQARLRYDSDAVIAEFPPSVSARNGETVKLAGFMMPLEPERRQKHFLLTSNPPSCFFHIPGGPAGAVEVYADEGIDVSWDPLVLEGRFETVANSEMGVIYRLHGAARLR